VTLDLSFQLEEDLAAIVDGIRDDDGAPPIELARRGVAAVVALTDKEHYERPLHIWMEVQGLARALLAARPECMPVVNLASATVEPLPVLYGRGKDEGGRMRADLRTRALEWLAALNERAERIDASRSSSHAVSAWAMSAETVYLKGDPPSAPWVVVAGPEKWVPGNYEFPAGGFTSLPLASVSGVLTGEADAPESVEAIRTRIATLRFAPTLL